MASIISAGHMLLWQQADCAIHPRGGSIPPELRPSDATHTRREPIVTDGAPPARAAIESPDREPLVTAPPKTTLCPTDAARLRSRIAISDETLEVITHQLSTPLTVMKL